MTNVRLVPNPGLLILDKTKSKTKTRFWFLTKPNPKPKLSFDSWPNQIQNPNSDLVLIKTKSRTSHFGTANPRRNRYSRKPLVQSCQASAFGLVSLCGSICELIFGSLITGRDYVVHWYLKLGHKLCFLWVKIADLFLTTTNRLVQLCGCFLLITA